MYRIGKIIIQTLLWIWALLMITPLIYMIVTSFKSDQDIMRSPWSLPKQWNFDNYKNAWFGHETSSVTLGTNFSNSVFVTVASLLLLIIVSTLAGYALGRHRFPGGKWIYLLFIGFIAVPIHALIVPLWNFMDSFGLLNNLWGVVFVYAAVSLPFSIIIMRSYFESIPSAVEEAARMDGCREFGVFWYIGLPLSKGAIATVIIVNIVNIWSELLFATVLLTKPEMRTLPLAISLFSENMYSSSISMLFAGLTMATVPLLIMYIFFQKQIVKGMALGAVK